MRDFLQTRNRGILGRVYVRRGLCPDAADYAHTATDVHRPIYNPMFFQPEATPWHKSWGTLSPTWGQRESWGIEISFTYTSIWYFTRLLNEVA